MNEKAISGIDSLDAILRKHLKKGGLEKKAADEICAAVINDFIKDCGGASFYVSSRYFEQVAQRNAELLGRFNGRNHAELAKLYGISVPQVYRIIKECHDARRNREQANLF